MPNRIIKESICSSETLAKLSADAERLFYRLIVQCDDFGLMLADPRIVKSRCFQLTSDAIKEKQMVAWLNELENVGLLFFYEMNNTRYLKFVKWEKHNGRRSKNPKYPLPESIPENLHADASICTQMHADPTRVVFESSIRDKYTRVDNETSIRDKKTERAPLVLLSDVEMELLVSDHGEEAATWMINKLSNYKQANGKKYKSDAAAIRSWVVKTWLEDKAKPPGGKSVDDAADEWLRRRKAAEG